jgi:hypothetical protein
MAALTHLDRMHELIFSMFESTFTETAKRAFKGEN